MTVEYLLHESSVGYAVSYILRTYEEEMLTMKGFQSSDAGRYNRPAIEGVPEKVSGSCDIRFVHGQHTLVEVQIADA
jgi:hypothetical protein